MINSELVIIHQNINQKFFYYEKRRKFETRNTPEVVFKNLLEVANEKKAHLIICTEFKVLDNYKDAVEKPLTDAGYVIFKNEELKKMSKGKVNTINQVLIAVKSDIVTKQESVITPIGLDQNDEAYSEIRYGLTYDKIGETPNYLRVDLELNGKPYSIIGTRIRILNSGWTEERIFRAKQLNILINELPEDRELIIVGDFNTSPSDKFRHKNSEWHFDDVYIKSLTKYGLKCHYPEDGYSPCKSTDKLDHIVTTKTSKQLKVIEINYIGENYCKGPNNENMPDHAILYAKIKLL